MKINSYLICATQKNIQNPRLRNITDILSAYSKRALKIVFAFLFLITIAGNVNAQATYTWNGTTTDFQVPGNWNPARGTLTTSDTLVFPSTFPTVINVPTQTIGEIIVQAGAAITLTPTGVNTLTLSSASSIAATGSLTILNNLTLANSGAFSNDGVIYGPGTLQLNSSVNIPSGSGAGGYFSHTVGSLLSLTVGDGVTANTVTSTAMDTVNNLTVNTPSTLALNNSIVLPVAGDLTGAGTASYAGADTITLFGSAVQNITTSVNFPFPALTINNSVAVNNNVTLLSDITVNGVLTFSNGNINAATNNHTVIISATGSVAGAAQGTGWVNGNLQMPIPGSGLTNFDIGDPAIYAPINLNLVGASASSITAYTLPTNSSNDPGPGYPSGIDQTQHVLRYWRMTNNGVILTSYDANFNFAASDIVGNPGNWVNYVVRAYDPALLAWSFIIAGARSPSSTQASVLTSFGTPFSDFEIGIDSSILLPISLLSFTAIVEDHDVLLNWSTASEINNNYFTVEKAADESNFSTVGKINGAGNSTDLRNYSLVDPSPYPGVSYYRLKQTDYDGKFTYSQLEAVDFNKNNSGEVTIFPNPASDKIYFSTSQADHSTFTLHIFDMKGSEAIAPASIIFSDGNFVSVDVSSLAEGVYTIQLISDKHLQQEKFIKN